MLGVSLGSPGVLQAFMQPDGCPCCTSPYCPMRDHAARRTASTRETSLSCCPDPHCTCMMDMQEHVKAWAAHDDFQFDLGRPAWLPLPAPSTEAVLQAVPSFPSGYRSAPDHPPKFS